MRKPFISVVICTYNGSKTIGRAIGSLLHQTYNRNLFEIIVVDDGSTDITASIVRRYPVKYINLKINSGLSAARNIGLKDALGEIYVCFDDDAVASETWLEKLVICYQDSSIMGASGIVTNTHSSSLLEEYLHYVGYGNPTSSVFKKAVNPLERFKTYINTQLTSTVGAPSQNKIFEVFEIPGVNSSFRTADLKDVGGWNKSMSGVEDTELCYRLSQKYKTKRFVCNPTAELIVKQNMGLLAFASKQFKRSSVNVKYHLDRSKFPPLFPFPILLILLLPILTKINPVVAAAGIVLIPQVLYFWWFAKCLKTKNIRMLAFPYYQLIIESFVDLGIMVSLFRVKILHE